MEDRESRNQTNLWTENYDHEPSFKMNSSLFRNLLEFFWGGRGSFLFSMKEQLNFFLDRTGKEPVEISKFRSKSDPRPIERAAFSFDKQFPRFLMVISRYRAGGIDYRKRNYDRWRGGEGDTRGGGGMVEF